MFIHCQPNRISGLFSCLLLNSQADRQTDRANNSSAHPFNSPLVRHTVHSSIAAALERPASMLNNLTRRPAKSDDRQLHFYYAVAVFHNRLLYLSPLLCIPLPSSPLSTYVAVINVCNLFLAVCLWLLRVFRAVFATLLLLSVVAGAAAAV